MGKDHQQTTTEVGSSWEFSGQEEIQEEEVEEKDEKMNQINIEQKERRTI